jgi:hypothetical protein
MLIAHLPAGYLIAKAKEFCSTSLTRTELKFGLLGAVIPDIDMLWFWTIDHHHGYFTHWPIFWLLIWIVGIALSKVWPRRVSTTIVNLFGLGALSHMILDSVAAPIMWLAPFTYQWFEFANVPASPHGATYAMITHWTFAIELCICAGSLVVLALSRWSRARS